MEGKTTRELGAGSENFLGSRGTSLGSREQRRKNLWSREQRIIIREQPITGRQQKNNLTSTEN